MPENDLLQKIHAALGRHRRLASLNDLHIRLEDDVVVLEGIVGNIAAKRLIPRIVIEASGGAGVQDRLRLKPDEPRGDADIAESAARILAGEPVFEEYHILQGRLEDCGAEDRDAATQRSICVNVTDAVIELSGSVESLSHRRLAEVLSWWVPGGSDVENRVTVSPAEMDSDDEITDAVRLVLEKDPWVDAGQIAVRTRNRVVTLTGTLRSEEQKRMAENDAWYVTGVHDVQNDIRSLDWEKLEECADEASRESFPASDAPSFTPIVGVGGPGHGVA